MTPTPKEKAQELVDKYRTYIRAGDKYEYLDPEDEEHLAIKCALVAVDEILKSEPSIIEEEIIENVGYSIKLFSDRDYWLEVKDELIKSE